MAKKILTGLVIAFILMVAPAWAQQHVKKYTLYLATTDSGVTTPKTVALSGVTEPLLIDDGGNYKRTATDTTLRGLASLPSGNAVLFIDTVTASQEQLGKAGTYSGNTFFVSAKFGHAGSNFNLLEKIPLVVNMALSGPTPYGIPFQIPPGTEAAQFFFGPSGVTAYGNFKGSLIVGLTGPDWKKGHGTHISSQALTCSSTSGVSTLTVPDGTLGATLQPGGNGIYYTLDGTTPSTSSKRLTTYGFMVLDAGEARKLKFYGDSSSNTVLNADYFTVGQ